MVEITPLPGAPAVVEGVVNVRGTVVPVLDLRARFGLPPRAVDPGQHLIILGGGTRAAAVRVDAADDFISVPDGEVAGPGSFAESTTGVTSVRHLAGVAATVEDTTVILNLAEFLSSSESEALDHALAPGG